MSEGEKIFNQIVKRTEAKLKRVAPSTDVATNDTIKHLPIDRSEYNRPAEKTAIENLTGGDKNLKMTPNEIDILLDEHPEAKADLEKARTGKISWETLRDDYGWN